MLALNLLLLELGYVPPHLKYQIHVAIYKRQIQVSISNQVPNITALLFVEFLMDFLIGNMNSSREAWSQKLVTLALGAKVPQV